MLTLEERYNWFEHADVGSPVVFPKGQHAKVIRKSDLFVYAEADLPDEKGKHEVEIFFKLPLYYS